MAAYEPSDATWASPSTGQTLLKFAMGNRDVGTRVTIAMTLLDDGADASWTDGKGVTLLHVLLARPQHDYTVEAPLVERLIAGGADINRVSPRFGTPLEVATMRTRLTDEELAPLYGVFFSQPDLDLLQTSVFDRAVMANLRQAIGDRTDLVTRAETYLADHGLTEEDT